ncbi:hypothetical protein E2I00_010217 [Balaenoptera physalus]|jgi:hypothetical protein
MTLTS